jgi:hypothetical protein
VMTLTKTTKRTATARTSGPHRTRATRRSVHRSQEPGARSQERSRTRAATRPAVQAYSITVRIDRAQLTEARDWTILAGVSLVGWLTAAIVFGVV